MAAVDQAYIVELVLCIKNFRARIRLQNSKRRLLKHFVNYLCKKRRQNTLAFHALGDMMIHVVGDMVIQRVVCKIAWSDDR